MSTTSFIETINHALTTKYPGLFLLLMAGAFAWFTTFKLNDMYQHIHHIETVDLPGIRQDINEMRQNVRDLDVRLTNIDVRVARLEVNVDNLEKKVDEIGADVKTILTILALKKNP